MMESNKQKFVRGFAKEELKHLDVESDIKIIELLYDGYSAQCAIESAEEELRCAISTLDEVKENVKELNEQQYRYDKWHFKYVEVNEAIERFMNIDTDKYDSLNY